MGKNLNKEETQVSAADLKVKITRLEFYVKRADRRISILEKKMLKLAKDMDKQNIIMKKKVMA